MHRRPTKMKVGENKTSLQKLHLMTHQIRFQISLTLNLEQGVSVVT